MMKIPGKLQWAWFLNLAIRGNTTINWKMAARNSSVTIKMTTTTTVCCFRWGPPPPGTWWFPVNDTILMYECLHAALSFEGPGSSDFGPRPSKGSCQRWPSNWRIWVQLAVSNKSTKKLSYPPRLPCELEQKEKSSSCPPTTFFSMN